MSASYIKFVSYTICNMMEKVTWPALGVPQVVYVWTLIRFRHLVLLLDPCKFLQPKGVQIALVLERYTIPEYRGSDSSNLFANLFSWLIRLLTNCFTRFLLGYVSNLPLHWDEDGKWTWPENWSIWLILLQDLTLEDLYFCCSQCI
jgi:hypothetical protein